MISDQNDFNNYAYRRFLETIKDALDPNGILSPGKMGVWPEKYRHLRDTNHRTANGVTNGTHESNGTNGTNETNGVTRVTV